MKRVKSSNWTWVLAALISVGLLTFGCGKESKSPVAPQKTEFEILQPAADAYTGSTQPPVVSAQTVFDNINDGNPANDYFILSVRKPEDYAKGHIPGAINIFWRDIGKAENIAKLPKDKKIAVYCYTGHTGAVATTLLNVMGYEAYDIKWGIMAWTKDQTARVQNAFSEDVDAHDFTVETKINTVTKTYDLPNPDYTASTDETEILQAACDYVATHMTPVTTAQALFDNLNDGNPANDPIIVSVRKPEHYALGHIPGAINIYWRDIAKEENLKKLDPSKDIVVYCYTGHTGEISATVLNMLGYKATNLKFGIMAWTKDPTVRVQSAFSETVDAHEFPLETGTH
ncbi:MAG: rhodanese-like domain-containing protein [Calditrichaeota bacterium]|nr:MAG: rhodanese-like domain-containing protein [Calditrichota bacterium]